VEGEEKEEKESEGKTALSREKSEGKRTDSCLSER
jgi:hypothetical protein